MTASGRILRLPIHLSRCSADWPSSSRLSPSRLWKGEANVVLPPSRGLSVCTGIGGLELGLKIVLGDDYRTVAYVERDAYAAAILVARMAGQALDIAPVLSRFTTF